MQEPHIVTIMQLGQYYLDIIRITGMDAIVLGAGAGLLVATYFGMRLRRENGGTISNSVYGVAGVILGTLFGYFAMNAVGYFVALSGTPFHGLLGSDLIEWRSNTSLVFTRYQVHAVGFAMVGSWFGLGWGYGIRPDETSLFGNIIATLGVFALLGGLLLMIMPQFLSLPPSYLTVINGIFVLCYVIALRFTKTSTDSSLEPENSEKEEPIAW